MSVRRRSSRNFESAKSSLFLEEKSEQVSETITVICRFRPFKVGPAGDVNGTRQLSQLQEQKVFSLPPSTLSTTCLGTSFPSVGDDGGAVLPQTVKVVLDAYGHRDYIFDRVHDMNSTQDEVFTGSSGEGRKVGAGVEEIVDSVMNGYNGTVLACM